MECGLVSSCSSLCEVHCSFRSDVLWVLTVTGPVIGQLPGSAILAANPVALTVKQAL